MIPSQQRKDHPLSLRMPETDIGIIDRAAGLKGTSRTEFIRDAAVKAAEDTILEQGLIRMSVIGFEAFVAAIDAPGQRIDKMAELASRPLPWNNKAKVG
jgi:uncharacterized protein (DUF1778 family)